MIRGLAEIVERRPNDPIEYLATYLYKQVNNTRAHQQVGRVYSLDRRAFRPFLVERRTSETTGDRESQSRRGETASSSTEERNPSPARTRRPRAKATRGGRSASTRSRRSCPTVISFTGQHCPQANPFDFFSRHKEMAAAVPPSLPAVREEDDETFIVEFGETELHRQAATHGNLNQELRLRSSLSLSLF